MPHAAVQNTSILAVAATLGLNVRGRHARCFNATMHDSKKDERPSLAFFADNGRFKCYACGVFGDSIDLVRAVRNCGFREAVDWIESLDGEAYGAFRQEEMRPQNSSRLPDEAATHIYAALYKESFEVGPKMPAGHYLQNRGLDLNLVNHHRVAQMEDTRSVWSTLVSDFGLDALKAAGLVSRSNKFLFAYHRLLFFYLENAWPMYVQARDVTGKANAKELSLAGLRSPVPFNVDLLQNPIAQVYVCEGCIDTLSALQMGFPAVGVPGVMGFQSDWYKLFDTVEHVVLFFDNDEAGRRQTVELRSQFRMRGIKADAQYPQRGKDVNDMLLARKKETKNV